MFEEAIEALTRCIDRFETAGSAIKTLSSEVEDAVHTAEMVVSGVDHADLDYAVAGLKQIPDEMYDLMQQFNVHIESIMSWLETVKGAAV
jgi:hypothetical protein